MSCTEAYCGFLVWRSALRHPRLSLDERQRRHRNDEYGLLPAITVIPWEELLCGHETHKVERDTAATFQLFLTRSKRVG